MRGVGERDAGLRRGRGDARGRGGAARRGEVRRGEAAMAAEAVASGNRERKAVQRHPVLLPRAEVRPFPLVVSAKKMGKCFPKARTLVE